MSRIFKRKCGISLSEIAAPTHGWLAMTVNCDCGIENPEQSEGLHDDAIVKFSIPDEFVPSL